MAFRELTPSEQDGDVVFALRNRSNGVFVAAFITLVLAVFAHWAIGRIQPERRDWGIELFAILLLGCAGYLAFGAYRLREFPRFELRFGENHLSFPAYPLWQQMVKELRYTDIEQIDMSNDNNGWWLWLTTREARHRIALSLLPENMGIDDYFKLAHRIELRVSNAKASPRLDAATMARLEREAFSSGRSVAAYITEQKDGALSIYGVLDDPDDVVTVFRDDNPWGVDAARIHRVVVFPKPTIAKP